MPKYIGKCKAKNGTSVKCNDWAREKEQKIATVDKFVKKELFADTSKATVVKEVFQRKSERRRFVRDIFLVFEEESSCRRKTRSKKKQSKPKFSHLKVDNPTTPKTLLRDIKNDQKCGPNNNFSLNAILKSDVSILKNISDGRRKRKSRKITTTICKTENNGYSNNLNNIKSIKISSLESQPSSLSNETKLVAKINPIFLWVKQDDTRIVEVRCEDYDKRNRIRLTKTSSGWRAIPRSDPTTSRVLKIYPTPLMKVKRETNFCNTNHFIDRKIEDSGNIDLTTNIVNNIDTNFNVIDTVSNPLAIKSIINNNRRKLHVQKCESTNGLKITATNTNLDSTVLNIGTLGKNVAPISTTNSSKVLLPIDSNKLKCIAKTLTAPTNLYGTGVDNNCAAVSIKDNTLDLETDVDLLSPSSIFNIQSEANTGSQIDPESFEFHLCPKTGLFLSNHDSLKKSGYETNNSSNNQDASNNTENSLHNSRKVFNKNTFSKIHIPDENTESLEAKTKNLKDLLDDADLLQNCDDNANSGADLIDTLVKSCENNLIGANEITKASAEQLHQKPLDEANEIVVHLITDVSDTPKCLSFNEAGEIEGLNGELFQPNTFNESFDKQASNLFRNPEIMLHSIPLATETSTHKEKLYGQNKNSDIAFDINNHNLQSISETEESPKDLSYKKREDICPQSESRSQCAVTSSSDVITSPQLEELSSSSSETLKNVVLQQFLKLNALTAQHRMEAKDFGKQKNSDTTKMNKSVKSTDFIETVIIEDDNNSQISHEEPLKKRMRLCERNVMNENANKLVMIDKDPDPLTQLRLLIRNTQWNVPDPILVPKDRLNAVLASPAREIPLLITTRPELRLPEAFAYPEIIQNPNILVISMAQLEAILKKDFDVEKSTTEQKRQLSDKRLNCQSKNHISDLHSQSNIQHHQNVSKQPKNISGTGESIQNTNNMNKDNSDLEDKLSERRQTSFHKTDLNTAAMPVVNPMLFLPYFDKISQDIGKSIQKPISLQEKYGNSIPFYIPHQNNQINFENVVKNKDNSKMSEPYGLQSLHQQFKTNEELLIFQKIVQHQMQSILQLNQIKSDPSQIMTPVVLENSIEKSKSIIGSISNLFEQRSQKEIFPYKQKNTTACNNQNIKCDSNTSLIDESYNLRSSIDGRRLIESTHSNNQREIIDSRPRLTCKSLSNLLEPEHSTTPLSSSSIPCTQNLSKSFLKTVPDVKGDSTCKTDNNISDHAQYLSNTSMIPQYPRYCRNMNISILSNSEIPKRRDTTFDNNFSNIDAPVLTSDTNTPLWHPLFGSNSKTSYSSPWQWTTVTATGE